MNRRSYFYFNLILAGIIILLFVYAGFFAYSSHALHCVYKQATGLDCPTCGLTRAFHNILLGNFSSAKQLNPLSIKLFAFFFLQFLWRIFLIIRYRIKRNDHRVIIKWDIIFSIILFLGCFWQLILFPFKS